MEYSNRVLSKFHNMSVVKGVLLVEMIVRSVWSMALTTLMN